MPEQLGFDLPTVAAMGRADFMVAPSNHIAVAMIENWRNWPGGKLVLTGPKGAGKTHLAHVWANASGATVIPARSLRSTDVPNLSQTPVAVEDVPELQSLPDGQTALFHLHNLMQSEGRALLLTGTGAPKSWPLKLPDLISRIGAITTVALDPPDDALLTAVLAKLFADRQLAPKPELLSYLIRRMDRSFQAAQNIVERLDKASLARKKPITRALAADILDNTGASER
ncbi:MAG: DnaA/Hda family protein [Pseudomonadota bacterium]